MDQDLSSETPNLIKTTIRLKTQRGGKGVPGQDLTNLIKRHKILTFKILIELHFMKNIKIKLMNFRQLLLF